MVWLFFYLLALSVYDLRTGRIPNWCTVPLIAAGMVAHFPGRLDLWLACLLLISAWKSSWMGAGDAKLWMAMLWALPDTYNSDLTLLMSLAFLITGLVQILWRLILRKPGSGVKTPAAWRAIPFLLMAGYVH